MLRRPVESAEMHGKVNCTAATEIGSRVEPLRPSGQYFVVLSSDRDMPAVRVGIFQSCEVTILLAMLSEQRQYKSAVHRPIPLHLNVTYLC